MSKRKRRRFTPEQKVVILKKHLLEQEPLSAICDQYGLHPTVFYRWQKEFFEKGARAFEKSHESTANRLKKQVETLEKKLSNKNEVLSELMEEHVALKKTLGEL
jgi:transposase